MTDAQDQAENANNVDIDEKPKCGIIMPISATANHSAAHWSDVLTLISRAIDKAGFIAAPVWENTSIDRVSERIIGNIFQFPLVIADISDGNANVMLELGLRLASKKPTIVVVNSGGTIPFDIRDFHALEYPSSLSILEMEDFISKLASTLKIKYDASRQDGYTPFLGNVVVDVIEPNERHVPIQQFLLDRLDEISNKLNHSASTIRPTKNSPSNTKNSNMEFIVTPRSTIIFASFDQDMTPTIHGAIADSFPNSEVINLPSIFGGSYFAIKFEGPTAYNAVDRIIDNVRPIIESLGGRIGVSPSLTRGIENL